MTARQVIRNTPPLRGGPALVPVAQTVADLEKFRVSERSEVRRRLIVVEILDPCQVSASRIH